MAPKKGKVEPVPEMLEVVPPPETPEEMTARIAAEEAASQQELDNEWKKIPYVDQKDLLPGRYRGYELNMILKPWQQVKHHPHDFYKSSRPSRLTDLLKHYESGELQKRHDNLIFELQSWREREILKDDMRGHMRKMHMIQSERVRYQKLRKEIRAEQLHYESTLRWPLSPHAVRSVFEDEEDEEAISEDGALAEIPEGMPLSPEDIAAPQPSSSDAEQQIPSEPETPRRRKKKKAAAPRMRYSLFQYNLPQQLKRVITHGSDEKPLEYSTPQYIHTPAWTISKAQHRSDLAQEVVQLCAWEKKLPGGGTQL